MPQNLKNRLFLSLKIQKFSGGRTPRPPFCICHCPPPPPLSPSLSFSGSVAMGPWFVLLRTANPESSVSTEFSKFLYSHCPSTRMKLSHCIRAHFTTLAKKIETTAPVGTGACSLEHACACSLACVAVSFFFFGQGGTFVWKPLRMKYTKIKCTQKIRNYSALCMRKKKSMIYESLAWWYVAWFDVIHCTHAHAHQGRPRGECACKDGAECVSVTVRRGKL